MLEDQRLFLDGVLETAVEEKADVILLAGKGHETEQEIGTQRVHLDEREEIASFFQQNTL